MATERVTEETMSPKSIAGLLQAGKLDHKGAEQFAYQAAAFEQGIQYHSQTADVLAEAVQTQAQV